MDPITIATIAAAVLDRVLPVVVEHLGGDHVARVDRDAREARLRAQLRREIEAELAARLGA